MKIIRCGCCGGIMLQFEVPIHVEKNKCSFQNMERYILGSAKNEMYPEELYYSDTLIFELNKLQEK